MSVEETTEGRKPWEQMEGETDLWYGRFHQYLLAGPKRTVNGVYRDYRVRGGVAEETLKGQIHLPGVWYEAVSRWSWRERASAWDAENRRLDEEKWREQIMQPGEVLGRMSRIARVSLEPLLSTSSGFNGFRIDLEQARAAGVLDLVKELDMKDGVVLAKMHDPVAALRDLGRHHKLWTDKTEHGGTVKVERPELADLDDEELEKLESLLGQTRARTST